MLVFCKEPRPGAVKTRLAEALGPEGAADLAERMLADTVRIVRPIVAGQPGGALRFVLAAEDPARFAAWLADRYPETEQAAQIPGGLGERLVAGLRACPPGPRLALGMDAPDLPGARLAEALAALGDAEVVLGPAPDGGYYLLGLAPAVDPGFLRGAIRWSSATTLADTRAAAEAAGLRLALLAPHPDVDEPADLAALAARLIAAPHTAPATAAWLAERA